MFGPMEYLYVPPCGDGLLVLVSFIGCEDGSIVAIIGDSPEEFDAKAFFPFLANATSRRDILQALTGREGWCRMIPEAIFN